MHHCCNVVVGPEGAASAVLLRAGEVVEGLDVARSRRPRSTDRDLARGPARLCQALALDLAHDGADLTTGPVTLTPAAEPCTDVSTGPRVGLRLAADRPWRFWLTGEPHRLDVPAGGPAHEVDVSTSGAGHRDLRHTPRDPTEAAMSLAVLDRKHTIAPPGYNRWLVPPAALAIHLCIGQAYATSVYKTCLVDALRHQPDLGRHRLLDRDRDARPVRRGVRHLGGHRRAAPRDGRRGGRLVGRASWSAPLGIATGQLWLLYLGYGVIGGIGLGIGYISPVSTLIKWFPDRPGLATGLAIMGFGGGALVASPVESKLLATFDSGFDPKDVTSVASGSAVAVDVRDPRPRLPRRDAVRRLAGEGPRRRLAARRASTRARSRPKSMVTTESVSAANAVKTPQFWLLWVVLFCNVTAGIGILEQAAPMIQDFFRTGGESSVDPAAAAGFVGLLSICNMAGRFVWSSTSDVIGRKPIYMAYLGVGMVLYALLALVGHTTTGLFVLFAGIIISFYGGGFATVPAYLRDLFGTFQVGAIHGRLLTAWSAAGVAGPLIVNGFLDAEGTPGKLTYEAYKPALLTMVGVLAVGFVANLLIRQVADRFHEPDHAESQLVGEPAGGGGVATATRTRRTTTRPALLAVSWAVVGLPLVYGVYQTFVKVSGLSASASGRMAACSSTPGTRPPARSGRACWPRPTSASSSPPGTSTATRSSYPPTSCTTGTRPCCCTWPGPTRSGARSTRTRTSCWRSPRTGRTSRRPGTPTRAPTRTSASPRPTTPASSCSAAPRSSTTRTRRRRSWPPSSRTSSRPAPPASRPAPTSSPTGASCPASAACGCTSRRCARR